jgi:dTDP-4-amino-4,6-dideoxygalactose transaminase
MTVAVHIPITQPEVGDAEAKRLEGVLQSGWLTQGEETFAFERLVAERVKASHAIATSSATTALHLGMVLLGLAPGDEVLVPSYSFIATANIVRYVGATPVFVDIRSDTWNLDEKLLGDVLTARTRAIVPVHQIGMPAEMEAIEAFARERELALIEDAACALGSTYHGRPIGGRGNLAALSFHPRKVVTTGEGGMLLTDDPAIADRARRLASHGERVIDIDRHQTARPQIEEFAELGFNYRMSNLQGAVGVAQMGRLDGILTARRLLARRYSSALSGVDGLEPPVEPPGTETNFQSYMVRIGPEAARSRDDVMLGLRQAGIASRPGITAIHQQPIYRDAVSSPLPETDRAVDEALILPLYPKMTEVEQDEVIEVLRTLATRG